jgi:hypothetical protein
MLVAGGLRKLTLRQRATGHPPSAGEVEPSVRVRPRVDSVLQKSMCAASIQRSVGSEPLKRGPRLAWPGI